MQRNRTARVSGHIYLRHGKRGPVWYAKFRLPDGHQVNQAIGPQWTGKGRPPAGHFTERTAQAELEALLTDARRGTLAALVERTGATFADAAAEWLRHGEHERGVKPSTLAEYRSTVRTHLVPAFGDRPLEQITTAEIEAWRSRFIAERAPSRRTVNKVMTILHGVFERARRAYGLRANPVADVERRPERYSGTFDFYSPEEVLALVRAADSEQDAAIFLTAAFTGLRRGELIALRIRDADFASEAIRVRASYSSSALTTPKSGKVRVVPMVEEVAAALAKLLQRERFTGDDDLVFPGADGGYLDGSALRRRYLKARTAAKLRPLRLHDLRHTFGSLAISKASIRQVQEWMGHSKITTTERYLHHKSRADDARLLGSAFRVEEPTAAEQLAEETRYE